MKLVDNSRDSVYVFEGDMPWDGGNELTVYAFQVLHDNMQTWLAADGMHAYTPPRELYFRICRDHRPPDWVRDQIFYQILPDRFAQGDPRLAVQTDEYIYADGRSPVTRKAWGEAIDRTIGETAFYGGDLPGIAGKLDYLQDRLGITAIYLNPVFTSSTNHRYDTEDYFNVDRHLGGNDALAALSTALHRRGMRFILDIAVNHTSFNHPWFNRFSRQASNGAYNSSESPYRDWYNFIDEQLYVGWKGMQHIPVLNFGNPDLQKIMFGGPESIIRHWLRPPYAADGWRFDVMHMIGEGHGAVNNATYVKEFRNAMRAENPEAYVLGEQFYEATRWLQGEQQDASMNYYGFTAPVLAWIAGRDMPGFQPTRIDAAVFDHWLTQTRARIPYANQLSQFNLLGSHDTWRFLTAVDEDIERMRMGVTLLMTYAGVPSIYYGDEIGLTGAGDPYCRRCFDWNEQHWDPALFETYRSLIALRKARIELREGAYLTLFAEGDHFVFTRYTAYEATLVAINRGAAEIVLDSPAGLLPFEAEEWLQHGRPGIADDLSKIVLPGRSANIWTTTFKTLATSFVEADMTVPADA